MKHLKNVGLGVAGVLLVAMGLAVAGVGPAFGTEKITICHAAGQEGSTKFVTLNLPYEAVFGQGGHFNENGTPQAGHEQDYMGPCQGTTTETETETTPTETEPTTPTETEPPPTTTTTPTPTTPECPNNPGGVPPNPPGGQDGKPGNDRCIPDPTTPAVTTPTPTTPTPPVTTTTTVPPPTTTGTSSTPPVSQPSVAKPKSEPKPKVSKQDPVVKTAHICKTLKDGTERKWFEGGNGLSAGCYPIARGSY